MFFLELVIIVRVDVLIFIKRYLFQVISFNFVFEIELVIMY